METAGVSDSLPMAIIIAGAIGAACGGMLGARLARASFWKGPIVLAAAWIISSIIVSLLAAGLSISDIVASIIGTLSFIIVAGICGRLLKIGARVTANIILGGFLGAVLFSVVLVYATHWV